MVPDIPKAFELLKGEERVFVIGGGSIYREFWDKASQLYLTEVHTSPEGDTFIPAIDPDKWELIGREDHYADEKNEFDYSFLDYRLKAE